MKKAISEIFAIILLLGIGVSLATLVYLSQTNVTAIYPSQFFNTSYYRSRACVSLENVDFISNNVTIKNCGLVPLSKFILSIDLQQIPLDITKLDPKQNITVNYGIALTGFHDFAVYADFAETPQIRLNADAALAIKVLMDAYPTSVKADGSKSTITATVLDQQNNPVSGKLVTFSKVGPGFLTTTSGTTDSTGHATTQIFSFTEGTTIISGIADGVSNTTTVYFVTGDGTVCGDGVCSPGEKCPEDCGGGGGGGSYCGDGVCNADENSNTCPQDCSTPPTCGGQICGPDEVCQYVCENQFCCPGWVCCTVTEQGTSCPC